MNDPWAFPFGQPLRPVRPSANEPRPVFLLTGLPGSLQVRWTGPGATSSTVAALPVDNEPEPLWDGQDATERIEAWKRHVAFDPDFHGSVRRPAADTFGGRHLAALVLEPLGLTRSDCWITHCIDDFALSFRRWRSIGRFDPELDPRWAPWSIPLVRGRRWQTWWALDRHGDRLESELAKCRPELVITLGDVAMGVMLRLVDEQPDLWRSYYGGETATRFRGRPMLWRELPALRAMRRSERHRDLHRRWMVDPNAEPPASFAALASVLDRMSAEQHDRT